MAQLNLIRFRSRKRNALAPQKPWLVVTSSSFPWTAMSLTTHFEQSNWVHPRYLDQSGVAPFFNDTGAALLNSFLRPRGCSGAIVPPAIELVLVVLLVLSLAYNGSSTGKCVVFFGRDSTAGSPFDPHTTAPESLPPRSLTCRPNSRWHVPRQRPHPRLGVSHEPQIELVIQRLACILLALASRSMSFSKLLPTFYLRIYRVPLAPPTHQHVLLFPQGLLCSNRSAQPPRSRSSEGSLSPFHCSATD